MKKKTSLLIKILIFSLLILSLNFFQNQIKVSVYNFSSSLQKSFWKAGQKFSNSWNSLMKIHYLKKENEFLISRNQELIQKIIFLERMEKENQILREALRLNYDNDFSFILAQPISKDINEDFILINKGAKDGILKDMPVINEKKILIGKISKVFDNYSKVMLISNKNISFDAEIVEKDVSGLIRGKGSFKIFFDLLPKEKEISEGDIVISSNLGGVFPPGLLVGKVKKIFKKDTEVFQQAEITPFFKINKISYFFILTDY